MTAERGPAKAGRHGRDRRTPRSSRRPRTACGDANTAESAAGDSAARTTTSSSSTSRPAWWSTRPLAIPKAPLVNALLHHVRGLSGVGGEERPGIVHRLDRGTSGVMVVAKHDRAHRHLARQFHDRSVIKEYTALVWDAPARSDLRPANRTRSAPSPTDVHARAARAPRASRITSMESLGAVSLVHVTIGTGRTHQIRVHLSESGYPVVGDPVYGGRRGAWLRLPFCAGSNASFSRIPHHLFAPEPRRAGFGGGAACARPCRHVEPAAGDRSMTRRRVTRRRRILRAACFASSKTGSGWLRGVSCRWRLCAIADRSSCSCNPRRVILVRQFRYVIGRWIWEIPAGSLERGERPANAARRSAWRKPAGARTGSGGLPPTTRVRFCDELMHFYACTDLSRPRREAAQDPDEELEPRVFTLREPGGSWSAARLWT